MATLASMDWDEPLKGYTEKTAPADHETIIISPWPATQDDRLLVKHAVQALYEGGYAFAAIPITRRGYGPRLYAGLFLENQQIGFLKFMHKTRSLGSESNSTSDNCSFVNAKSDPQLVINDQPVGGVKEGGGTVIDPFDSKFKITYWVRDNKARAYDIFSAFLEALANVAPNDFHETGAFVNAVGVSGDIALNVHETGLATFTWHQLVHSLVLIWILIIPDDHNNAFDFDLTYDGVKRGEGFVLNVTAPGSSLAFS